MTRLEHGTLYNQVYFLFLFDYILPCITMYHYIRFRISPPSSDALGIRKAISDALLQTFGLSAESTYVDVLSIAESGQECVLRVRSEYVQWLSDPTS